MGLADARARAREHVRTLTGAPEQVTIEVDATLIIESFREGGGDGTFGGG